MLDLPNSVRLWIMHFAGSLCLTSMAVSTLSASQTQLANDCTPDNWLQKNADQIRACSDAQDLVQLIIEMRNYLISQNCEIPNLTAFLERCRVSLSNQGFLIEDAVFDALKREIRALERDDAFDQVRHHKKKKNKELKVSSKVAVGFLKFVAGGLLCLVPIPLVQGAGVGLAVLGVSEMADGAREQADQREKYDENQRINRELEFNR